MWANYVNMLDSYVDMQQLVSLNQNWHKKIHRRKKFK